MQEQTALPLPVATLLRRARNAKSPKDRHDTAYFAWEVSVRLAVAARPPQDVSSLARGSVGHWVRAVDAGEDPLDAGPILKVFLLAKEVGTGKRLSPQSVSARRLLDALPAYRNQVIGHGSTRAADFYAEAGETLIAGLEAAWEGGVFLPRGARLLFAEAVELDADGTRRARLLDLAGVMSQVLDPRGTVGVPDDLLPRRVYLREGDTFRSLHPWVLFEEAELRERALFFNGLARRAAFLDYASGEALKGTTLEEAFPGVEAEVFALFSQEREEQAPEDEEDPDLFGDYRILGKLGAGGMGVVYLARQESLGRLVALKMLPAQAADDPTAVARFKREVAALGRCEHPNVVKILASGEAKGTHYYAMEYVEGADLSQVAKALSTSADFDSAVSTASEQVQKSRAELFADVPQVPKTDLSTPKRPKDRHRQIAESLRDAALGLHHLHESGIVHRDVKPANLMVTAAEHRVVVMDLGLAAIGDASRAITRDRGQILGTLRYMPPEQLQRNLLQVDHRADIYALGATFYELLTDRPFFDGDTEVRLIEQVLREDPLPAQRANSALPGDLATIVGKATEKDPKLRYENAAALADDVNAYLGGRPIRAKPPTLGYVLRLAIQRNRPLAATIAAAAVVVVALTTYFITSLADERDRAVRAEAEATDKAAEAGRERRRADLRATEAEQERARAEDLANFMLFDLRDGLEPLGRLDLLKKVARRAQEYYESLPAEDVTPDVLRAREAALGNVGNVQMLLGDLPSARRSHEGALAIAERLAASDPTNTSWQRDLSVSHNNVGHVALEEGDLPAARRRFEASLAITERLAASDPTNTTWQGVLSASHNKVGDVARNEGDPLAARRSHEAALAITERLVASDPTNISWQRDLSVVHDAVGTVARQAGDLPAARRSHEASFAIAERLAASDPTNTTWQRGLSVSHNNVGDVALEEGDFPAARRSYEAALAIAERLAASDPTNTTWQRDLSVFHHNVGHVALEEGDLPAARRSHEAALAIAQRLAASDPTNTSWQRGLSFSGYELGGVLVTAQEYSEAVTVLRDAVKTHARAAGRAAHLGKEHHLWEERLREAELLAGERVPETAAEHVDLGYALYSQKRWAESSASFEQGLSDEKQRADISRANLYNATCSAALAVAAGEEKWRARAIEWLGEDLRRRHDALKRIDERLSGDVSEEERAQFGRSRSSILKQFEWARTGDSDLAAIRGTPEFEKLFAGLPNGK